MTMDGPPGISAAQPYCGAMTRPAARRTHRASLSVRRPDPRVWTHALQLAAGNHRRLEVLTDGTVVVHNRRMR